MKKYLKNFRSYRAMVLSLVMIAVFSLNALSAKAYNATYDAHDEPSLRFAISHAKNGDFIRVNNDIVLHGDLKIKKSITVDLGFHAISFKNSKHGLYIDLSYLKSVVLQNGSIYGTNGVDYNLDDCGGNAVTVAGGNTTISNVSLFGGNGANGFFIPGDGASALIVKYGNVYLDYVYLKGGNAGTASNNAHVGKAAYALKGAVFSIGRGWTYNNGEGRY